MKYNFMKFSFTSTMAVVTYLIIFSLIKINVIDGQDCIINNRTPENSWEQQLELHLRCGDFDLIQPTINATGEINVRIKFALRYFTYDYIEEEFSMQTWIFMSWTDDRLKWNPEDFHGINETTTSYVWIPSLRLFNSESDAMEYFSSDPCTIKSDGSVLCVLPKHHYVTCRNKMANWPYNVQKCVMGFGTWPEWLEKGVNVTLSFSSRALNLDGSEDGAEWVIVDYEQEENINTEEQLRMIFTLERKPSVITAIILVPSIIVTVLTIICLFLDVRSNIRLALLGLSLAVHFECLTVISNYLPSNTADPPTILLYLRGSVIVTAMSCLLTLLLGFLCKKETTPFQWISTFNSFVLNGYGKTFIWPRWIEEVEISKDILFSVEWTNFACILNRICTLIIIVVYVCLFITFMPRPVPMEKHQL